MRFSPEGARLATGGDGGELYLWRKGGGGARGGAGAGGAPAFGADPDEEPSEGDEWRVVGVLR